MNRYNSLQKEQIALASRNNDFIKERTEQIRQNAIALINATVTKTAKR